MAFYSKPATKADVQHLIDWLDNKNPETEFNANNIGVCLISQYIRDVFSPRHVSTGMDTVYFGDNSFLLPSEIKIIAYGTDEPRSVNLDNDTFGNALDRAKSVLAKMT